MKPFCN